MSRYWKNASYRKWRKSHVRDGRKCHLRHKPELDPSNWALSLCDGIWKRNCCWKVVSLFLPQTNLQLTKNLYPPRIYTIHQFPFILSCGLYALDSNPSLNTSYSKPAARWRGKARYDACLPFKWWFDRLWTYLERLWTASKECAYLERCTRAVEVEDLNITVSSSDDHQRILYVHRIASFW